jgi:tRNA/tmRNA/rRNA uracil-C5-methylase (TrmA/RlmC/RlmD family)
MTGGVDVPVGHSDDHATSASGVGSTLELVTGAMASGGGCVARAPDGRVVFVRHSLPGERVVAEVTAETSSFLRADAVEILEPSADRTDAPCPHAGPGRCGGCDWQHIALPAQRGLKAGLVSEQLRRVAGIDRQVEVVAVAGAADGLGWRTRVRFAVDRSGRIGLHRHRSHDIEPVEHCPIATSETDGVGVGTTRWKGAHHVEVTASPDGGRPVVAVETGRRQLAGQPRLDAGLVVNGRTLRPPDRSRFDVLGRSFEVSAGVFWQVHPRAAALLTGSVLDGLAPEPGECVVDLFAGAGLLTVALAHSVGPRGRVVGVERSRRACADAVRNAAGLRQVEIIRADIDAATVARVVTGMDLVVLDPARQGAGTPVMRALASLDPPLRGMAYVSCDPASFARDLRIMLDAGWSIRSLRAFDLFPMTEHVELVSMLSPPAGRPAAGC